MRRFSPLWKARGLIVLSLFAPIVFAGCVGEEDADPIETLDPTVPDADLTAPDGRDLATALTAEDELPAPAWRVGDWWELHYYFGGDPENGNQIEVVVAESGATHHTLATSDPQVAKLHALEDLPILGAVTLADLATTGFGGAWDLLEFPLRDNATWDGEIPNIAFDILPAGKVALAFTATYVADLDVAGTPMPGYKVDGLTSNGTLLVSYTYAPAVRWITSLTVFDIDPGQDPLEFNVQLLGHGRDWNGTYYIDEATIVVDNLDAAGFDDDPTDGGKPFVSPSPYVTFTVSEKATYLYGVIFNGAILGARMTVLLPPEGDARHYEAVGAPEQGSGVRIDEAAIAGEWRIFTAGAGGVTASEVHLAELVETTGTL